MLRQLLRYIFTLMGLQLLMSAIAFLLSDYRLLAVAAGAGFLALVWLAGRSFGADLHRRPGLTVAVALATGLLWQLPGLQGSIRFASDVIGWTEYDGITDLQDFVMETWHTVLLPLLGVLPAGHVAHYYARYYVLLVAAAPALALLFAGAALSKAIPASRAAYRSGQAPGAPLPPPSGRSGRPA